MTDDKESSKKVTPQSVAENEVDEPAVSSSAEYTESADSITPGGGGDQGDALLESLVYIADTEQLHCTRVSLIAGMPLIDGKITPEIYTRAARRIGLSSQVVQRNLAQIPSLVLPAVLILKNNDALVLTGIDVVTRQAQVHLPLLGQEQSLDFSALEKIYEGLAIYSVPEPGFDSRVDKPTTAYDGHWFWRIIGSSRKIYRDVLIASLLINMFVLANPLFVMNVYDRVVPNNAVETLWALAIGILVLYIFDFILRSLRVYFIEVAGKKADVLLSSFIFERVLNAKFDVHPQSVGAFSSQFRDFETVRSFVTSATVTAFVDLPFVLLFLLAIYYIGGPIIWVPLIAIPLIVGYSLLAEKSLKKYVSHSFSASAQKNATLVEAITNLETLKVLGAEGKVLRLWEKSVGNLAFWGLKSRVISTSATTFASFVQQIAGVFAVIVGVYGIAINELTQGALIACVMLVSRAVAPLAQVSGLLVQYYQSKLALEALDEIVKKPQERNKETKYLQKTTLNGRIEFKDVSFSYPGDSSLTLKKVSFSIKPGEKVALIGRIGSGKSTIQKLLLGLYSASKGSVLIDDVDISQIDPADLRNHTGYVPQESTLFFGSIRDNIHYGQAILNDEEMLRAAKISGVSDFVNNHEHGFQRMVGERGELLSGGQRQSINIARALISDPSLYIFDEPTNSMDNTSEARFLERVKPVVDGKTLLLVTHKMSLLALVDRVIVLDRGQIVADGAKDSVIEALKKGQLNVS